MQKWTETDTRLLVKFHGQGLDDRRIGDRIGRHYALIGSHRRLLGLPSNKPHGWKENSPSKQKHLGRIAELAAQGYSSGRIAVELGVSRNVVIGLCTRNGIRLQRHKDDSPKSRKVKRYNGKTTVVFQRDPYRGEAPTGCRYPHGEPGQRGFKWCNGPRQPGSPYCPEHHRLCHVPRMMEAAE